MTTRPFSLRASLGAAFRAYKEQPVSHLAGWLLFGLLSVALSQGSDLLVAPDADFIGRASVLLGYFVAVNLLAFGPIAYCLAIYRRRPLSRKVFQPARPQAIAFVLGSVLLALVSTGGTVVGSLVSFVTMMALLLYNIFLPELILDRKMGINEASKTSAKLVKAHAGKMLLLFFALLAPTIVWQVFRGAPGPITLALDVLVEAAIAHFTYHTTTHAYVGLVPVKRKRKQTAPIAA